MKSTRVSFAVVISAIAIGLFACNKEDSSSLTPVTSYLDLPSTPYQYGSIFGSDQRATLGRVLFYDQHLSVNNSVSCASCHKQTLAFSDDKNFSAGFQNQLTKRNALPIQNLGVPTFFFGPLANAPSLFWDGREKFLVSMVLKPMVNHVEMGMGDLNSVVNKIKAAPYYADLFTNAFGTDEITISKIAQALSTFVSSINSGNTRFDQFNSGLTQLTGLEEQGRSLFFTKYNCNSCHKTEFPNGYQMGGGNGSETGFVNIGLDANYSDNGLGEITNNVSDNGRFKIPNLRNIVFTAPYMHDGRFTTLNQVLDHYSHNIANHPNLDVRLKGANNQPLKMNISTQEKGAIIAFLNTLADYSMMTDPKFSNPFKIH